MTWVGIIALLLVLLGGIIGWKRGVLRSLINLIGLVSILILSYQFKDYLGTIIIRFMPFVSFGGKYAGIYAVNFIFYQAIAFSIVFLLLYCVLNILINLSGMIEVLDRFTKVFELPSKIMGVFIGAVEMAVYVFILSYVLLAIPTTSKFVMKDNVVKTIALETPAISKVFGLSLRAEQKQYLIVEQSDKTEEGVKKASLDIVTELVVDRVVDAKLVQEMIDNGKLHLDNVTIASD